MKLGADIGGTTVKGALFEGLEFFREAEVPTHGKEGREAILRSLFTVLDALMAERKEVSRIGISSAGNIDPYRGICVYATENLIGWTGTEIKKEVETRYHIPCDVDNDAVCALKGELLFYPDLKDVTMLTFGTGVGGASLVGGKLLRGEAFDGARWGHLTLVEGGRRCSCGKYGCAESYLSATALFSRGREKIFSLTSCKQLFSLYEEGNGEAKEVLSEFGNYLNQFLRRIREEVSPEKIILGGGMAQSESILLSLIEDRSDIAFARLKNRAGIVGACIDKE